MECLKKEGDNALCRMEDEAVGIPLWAAEHVTLKKDVWIVEVLCSQKKNHFHCVFVLFQQVLKLKEG